MAFGFRSKLEINNYYNRVAGNLENLEKLMFSLKKIRDILKSQGKYQRMITKQMITSQEKSRNVFFVRLNQFHLSLSNWYTLTCLRWDSTIRKISFSKLHMLINIAF